MATATSSTDWPQSRALLWLEFLALFVGTPLAIAGLIGVVSPIAILMTLMPVTIWLLHRTPDFRMRDLLAGPVLPEWKLILGFAIATAVTVALIALWLVPGRFLEIFRYRPGLWLTIMALYPLFSALPQEIIFRTLFFERYGRLFPSRQIAVGANAAVFGLGHLFFLHPVTVILTVIGGAIFAWAYLRNGSTFFAVVLHAIAGQLIFTSGLGIYFYHGAIG